MISDIPEILEELRNGRMIVLVDDEDAASFVLL
jgi:3,4-dihydroxy-2-butanone 4-phosphate synthase